MMRKIHFSVFYAGLVVLLFFIACKCKKLQYDYTGIVLDEYYSASLPGGETMYLVFHRADSVISGEYFIYKGEAVVEKFPFTGKPVKEQTVLHFTEMDGVMKTRGILSGTLDTVYYHYGSKKDPSAFVLVREKHKSIRVHKPRYNEAAFGKVGVQEITYGKAKGYYTSKPMDNIQPERYPSIILDVGKDLVKNVLMTELPLTLDLYRPVGDTIKKRPLLVIVHGGAFVVGDKNSATMREIGHYFARRGYLVASINYRMGYMFVPGGYMYLERCMYRAIQDARAAIRFLVNKAEEYRIDTEYIFIGGNSAGGFISLKAAFMEQNEVFSSVSRNRLFFQEDLGCLDCSGNSLKEKFQIRGVINMWGAITDTSIISKKENIPVLLFHGDADQIVPAGHQYPFANVGTEFSSFFSKKVYGSVSIHEHMQRLGLDSRLVLFPNGDHDPQCGQGNTLNENMNVILDNMCGFMFDIISADSNIMRGKTEYFRGDKIALFEVRGKGNIRANWEVEGGKIIRTYNNNNRVGVVWFADAPVHKVICFASNENGLVNRMEKIIVLTSE